VKNAKVVCEPSGASKGYGFVRFTNPDDYRRALVEMEGVYCNGHPMRVRPATARNKPGASSAGGAGGTGANATPVVGNALAPSPQPQASQAMDPNDPNNTTVFVGNLDTTVDDLELRRIFSVYGQIASVKIPAGKACGFIQFMTRPAAEKAIADMNGQTIASHRVRCSWGRQPQKPPAVLPGQPDGDLSGASTLAQQQQWAAYYQYYQHYYGAQQQGAPAPAPGAPAPPAPSAPAPPRPAGSKVRRRQ